jgi:GntP family gluconate:H+ symporter
VGGNYVFYILTIVAGATMAHSLVPPTPGPLIVVEQFGVDLGLMILAGTLVGLVASSAGYLLAMMLNRWMQVEVPHEGKDDGMESARNAEAEGLPTAQEQASSPAPNQPDRLPGLGWSLLPILLPVILIGMGTAAGLMTKAASASNDMASQKSEWMTRVAPVLKGLGDKNVALVLAATLAVFLLVRTRNLSRKQLGEKLQAAIMGAGMIILITAAGGAFGMSIRQCGIATEIAKLTRDMQPLMLLPLAFCITTMIRTAQGSATVAMVTAAGVLQGFADQELLQFNVVYLALAVGCGSKPIAWMADSGFWVICKMSGMTESQGLQTVTPMSVVMGLAGLLATIVGAVLLPWPDRILG